jgi:L-asparaginase
MTDKNTLHFIMTGGTIDSTYESIKDTVVPSEHSTIPQFIKILKLYEECIFTEVCMKDSRELTQEDRARLLEAVKSSESKRIIITHGTYTMPDTARYLKENLGNSDKVIIFVGAMIPLVGFTPTDTGFNLGYAVARSQELTVGIYVCMNGRIFAPDEVVKLISEGRFDSIYTK